MPSHKVDKQPKVGQDYRPDWKVISGVYRGAAPLIYHPQSDVTKQTGTSARHCAATDRSLNMPDVQKPCDLAKGFIRTCCSN